MVGFGVLNDLIDRGDAVQNLEPSVAAERTHASFHRSLHDLPTADAVGGELADFIRGDHQLVNAEAASITRVAALAAADGFVKRAILLVPGKIDGQFVLFGLVLLLAMGA